MRLVLNFLCAVLLLSPLVHPAYANPLSDGASTWTGEGSFRRDIGSALEGMRCRGQSAPSADGFVFSGRCVSAAQSASLELTATLSRGKARMTLSTSVIDNPIALSGGYSKTGLVVSADNSVMIGETEADFRLQINYTGKNEFLLTEFVTPSAGGNRTELAQIHFKR